MQSNIRVLHIISSLGDGGAETMLAAVCRGSQSRSINHTVVSIGGGGFNAELLRRSGIEVHIVGLAVRPSAIGGLFRLAKFLMRAEYDVVHTWMYHANLLGGLLAKAIRGSPIVWSIHHGELGSKSKWTTRFVNQLSAWLSYVVPDDMIAVSSHVAQVHVGYGYRDAFSIISNGCDISRFFPGTNPILRQVLGIPSSAFVIGAVARFSPEKGHDVIVSAIGKFLAERQDAYVLFVGNGCSKDNEAFVSALGELAGCERMICLGSRSDVAEIMRLLDLHVLASREEAFGNVTVEAMASGVPCIVSETGAAEHIVADTGWSVPVGDVASLRNAMATAYEEWRFSERWRYRQEKSRERVVEKFSMEKCLSQYEDVWSRCGH